MNLLKDRDHQGILGQASSEAINEIKELDDEEILNELGLDTDTKNDITELKYVKPRSEINRADEIGQRTVCKDFHIFKPLFEAVRGI